MTSSGEDGRLDAYIDAHMDRWTEDLAALCRQPSVSARHDGIAERALPAREGW